MAKKRLDKNSIGNTFLGDILKLHMDYEILLTHKIGFLVAISALILTIALTGFLRKEFIGIPRLLKLGVIIAAIGASFCIIICLSAERPEDIRKIKGIMPLSTTIASEYSEAKAYSELKKIYGNKEKMLKSYSEEMLHLKKAVYEKGRKFTVAIFTLIACMLIAAGLAGIQLYITIFQAF